MHPDTTRHGHPNASEARNLKDSQRQAHQPRLRTGGHPSWTCDVVSKAHTGENLPRTAARYCWSPEKSERVQSACLVRFQCTRALRFQCTRAWTTLPATSACRRRWSAPSPPSDLWDAQPAPTLRRISRWWFHVPKPAKSHCLHETTCMRQKKMNQKQIQARRAASFAVCLSPQRPVLLSGCTCSPFRRASNFESTMLTCNTRSCFAGRSSRVKRAPISASAPNISTWCTLRVRFEVQHRLRIPKPCQTTGRLAYLKRNMLWCTQNHVKQQESALTVSPWDPW